MKSPNFNLIRTSLGQLLSFTSIDRENVSSLANSIYLG